MIADHEDPLDASAGSCSDSNASTDFIVFARREFPRIVRGELETLFESEFQDIERRFRPRVEDIVLALQPRLVALYERSTVDVRQGDEASAAASMLVPEDDRPVPPPSPVATALAAGAGYEEPVAMTSSLPNVGLELSPFYFDFDWNAPLQDLFNNAADGLPMFWQDMSHQDAEQWRQQQTLGALNG